MSNPITCTIKGLDELQAKLEALPKEMANTVLKDSLRDAAQAIAESIAARVPHEHPEFDTGLLAKSINVKIKLKQGVLAALAYIGPAGGVDYPKTSKKAKK
jgi:hypothetical protein